MLHLSASEWCPSVTKETLSRRDSAVGFSQPMNHNSSVGDSCGGNGCLGNNDNSRHSLHRPSSSIIELSRPAANAAA